MIIEFSNTYECTTKQQTLTCLPILENDKPRSAVSQLLYQEVMGQPLYGGK
jgi:hypothetical protein